MKKSEQRVINGKCLDALTALLEENNMEYLPNKDFNTRLYHCQAWIAETERFLVLKSYDTIVALLDKNTGVMYDIHRLAYGYTATSSHHIGKFKRYCIEQYLMDYKAITYTYYAV